MTGIQELRIADIRTDGGTQPRAQLDMMTILEYTEAMQSGSAFPPVTVYYDGDAYWLADGFHRLHAAQEAGRDTISTDVRQGTRRDAVLYSVGANAAHGLRRTNADKRRAVEILLADGEWAKWSDAEIARKCAVSQPFVSKVRAENPSYNGYMIDRLVTRNGTTYPVNTANIGKHSEPEPPAYEPVAAWPTMDVGTDTSGPASEAETVPVERDELDRLHNIEQWAKYEGGYYGENEAYGEWGSTHEDEWNDARSGATPLSAYIPKAAPPAAPVADEGDTVSMADISRAIADARKETPHAQSVAFTSLLMKLDEHSAVSERSIEAWLDVTPPEQWVVATSNFNRLRAFMDDVERRMSERKQPRLRVIQ